MCALVFATITHVNRNVVHYAAAVISGMNTDSGSDSEYYTGVTQPATLGTIIPMITETVAVGV